MKQKKIEKEKENTFGINEVEFVNITFDHEWPFIIKHLADVLMGGDLLKSNKIKEEDEPTNVFLTEMCKEADLTAMKNEMKINQYNYLLNAFKVLQGKEN